MAFANATNWCIRSDGNANNGAGFNPANANFATDGSITTATGNSPVLSSASYNFVAGDVGASVFFPNSGTALAGWYTIASVATNKATLSAAVGQAEVLGVSGAKASSGGVTAYGSSGVPRSNRPIGSNLVAGCNTVASPTGVTWGVDYSQQASGLSITGIANGATATQITSVTSTGNAAMGVNWIGNILNVTSGTGFTVQRVEIQNVAAGVATVDKTLGGTSLSGGAGTLGGSAIKVTDISTLALAGNYLAIQATGTYTLAATWTLGAGVKGDTTNGNILLEGFTTVRGARDGRPLITSSTNSVHLITFNDNDFWKVRHLKMTHTAATRGGAFTAITSASSPLWLQDIICGTVGGSDGCLSLFNTANQTLILYLEGVEVAGSTGTTGALSNAACGSTWNLYGCYIHDGVKVLAPGNNSTIVNCQDSIFTLMSGIAWDFSGQTTANIAFTSHYCTYVDNGGDCVKFGNSSGTFSLELESNVVYNNTGWWINSPISEQIADQNTKINRNNCLGSNSSGNYNGVNPGFGDVLLTADPFVNRTGRNYALNSTAGGGAACRGAAFPASWGGVPDTLNYRDAGAQQHQDAGGGSGMGIFSSMTGNFDG